MVSIVSEGNHEIHDIIPLFSFFLYLYLATFRYWVEKNKKPEAFLATVLD